jgi:hypothetical protein
MQYARVRDLTPLRRMPLKILNIESSFSRDLTALEDMPLEELTFRPRFATNIEVVRRLKTLKNIIVGTDNGGRPFTPADFWKRYDAGEFK